MSQDDVEPIRPGWQAASQTVAQAMAEWRRAHPKATLTEIEDAVFEAMQKLQARALGQVVHASTSADVAEQPVEDRPQCPTCNAPLELRGRQRRTIRPARQRLPLDLHRSYAVCAEAAQYLSADGAMVPLVGGDWAEVKTLAIGEVEVRRDADGLSEAHPPNVLLPLGLPHAIEHLTAAGSGGAGQRHARVESVAGRAGAHRAECRRWLL